jgi:hypothetical protein
MFLALATVAAWWAMVLADVSFAWAYAGFTAGALLVTVALPAGAAALWIRSRPPNTPPRSLAGALVIAT